MTVGIKVPIPKTEVAKALAEATELNFINMLIKVNAMAQTNIRKDLKRLMREKQLLINIKKKWKS